MIRIGVLAPLSPPGWVEAGRHLLAGLQLARSNINRDGGIEGMLVELLVRDTAADPGRSAAAVDELAQLGAAAVTGGFHSVAASAAAARAEAIGLPYLCSSAVLDALTARPAAWVARLAPPQSKGWNLFADFLVAAGHRQIGLAVQPSTYWAAGSRILSARIARHGGKVSSVELPARGTSAALDRLAAARATMILLLVGHPEPAATLARSLRNDPRFAGTSLGAPAGQPEFRDWERLLGSEGTAVPFLRYLPRTLAPAGSRVAAALRHCLGQSPAFVALEGYDSLLAVAALLRERHRGGMAPAGPWSRVSVDGTRGRIQFSRAAGDHVWQWPDAPVQVADRDPSDSRRFRVLYVDGLDGAGHPGRRPVRCKLPPTG
jgi:ABC-type branched-subunit amino acid transport system substrate-binding protein